MKQVENGWKCHVSILQKGGWHDAWEWYPTQEEANEAGQKFLSQIDKEHEEAREYEIYKHFDFE